MSGTTFWSGVLLWETAITPLQCLWGISFTLVSFPVFVCVDAN